MGWLILAVPVGIILLVLVAFRVAIVLGGRGVRPVDAPALVRRPLEAVRVERLPNDDLHFAWSLPAEQVSIYAGPSPQAIDWQHPLLTVRGASEAVLAGLDPAQRFYFGLAFEDAPGEQRVHIAAERHLPLHGARNFRDLGGYRTQDGRRVRWGRIFRSDQLCDLTDSDQAYLERIGIQAVCDLRDVDERRDSPDRMPAQAAYHVLPIYEDQPRRPLLNILFFRRHLLGATLGRGYIDFLEHGAPSYGQLLRLAAEHQPLVYHCAAGKDRAGIASALLLALLGVPDETILADYSLSNLAFDHFYQSFVRKGQLRRLGVPNVQVQALFVVEVAWMEGLLAYLRETYGTVDNYLIQKTGLDAETIARLRADLLD